MHSRTPNRLAQTNSPYLHQHASNPVDWYPWGEEAWARARKENKLVIISIGYSTCHWCHVMERECFSDEEVARLMNEHFVSIKVDREEHPDIDQIYLTAVQLMTGHGGWPLNCITLPDGRPLFGGTYFPRRQWMAVLQQILEYYKHQPDDADQFAHKLLEALNKVETVDASTAEKLPTLADIDHIIDSLRTTWDQQEGGIGNPPKFPMPSIYQLLLAYYVIRNHSPSLQHTLLTLKKMAWGGIYDQLGGGFARYATDRNWKVPHFEKMLYDNAQLISLYARAFQLTGAPWLRQVVEQTFDFVLRELTAPSGGFCAALDADCEGEEGKFYVWTRPELEQLLGDDFGWFADYYNINAYGRWDDDYYILVRTQEEEAIAQKWHMNSDELRSRLHEVRQKLFTYRDQRPHPHRDEKEITAWNALMIIACCDAFDALSDPRYLETAYFHGHRNLQHYQTHKAYRHTYYHGRPGPEGYLDDYAFSALACMRLYQCTFDEQWLTYSRQVVEAAIDKFFDRQSGMFYFTARDQQQLLIARKMEITDDVIPSSASVMGHVLLSLSRYYNEPVYEAMVHRMLGNMFSDIQKFPTAYSHWAMLLLVRACDFKEVVISGPQVITYRQQLMQHYFPNILLAGTSGSHSSLPLLANRVHTDQTWIYVCRNGTCQRPVASVEEALELIR